MDQIIIKDLVARGIIGINDWEREKAQEIRINITLFADLSEAGESDDLHYTIDYSDIAKKCLAHAENAKRLTVEALAADLACLCLQDPKVHSARVRVEKPGAVRFAGSVGVEIERSKILPK
jgi:FolB domain-containing protein